MFVLRLVSKDNVSNLDKSGDGILERDVQRIVVVGERVSLIMLN